VNAEKPWEPKTPDEEIPQDPGIPGPRQGEEKPPELDPEPEFDEAEPPPDADD
jgi:hypothetical protein